jgi:hypothetical protein
MSTPRRLFDRVRASVLPDSAAARACLGVIGLFPMITGSLVSVFESTPAAIVVAAIGGVVSMALMPRPVRR